MRFCCLQDKFVDRDVDLIFLEYAINDGYTVSLTEAPRMLHAKQ